MKSGLFLHIKAIIFDLDGTLKISVPNSVDAVLGYISDAGIPIDEKARRAGHRFAHEYWADRERVEEDMDRFGPDSFWENYIRANVLAMAVLPPGVTPDDQTIASINQRYATEFNPRSRLAAGTLELLTQLKQSGYTVGLVSNRPFPLREPAEKLGIYEHFDFTLAAGEVGSWKPDAGIFHKALELAGNLKPEQAVYVGDNYYTDAIGAHQVGLKAVLIDALGVFPEARAFALVVDDLASLLSYFNETHATQS